MLKLSKLLFALLFLSSTCFANLGDTRKQEEQRFKDTDTPILDKQDQITGPRTHMYMYTLSRGKFSFMLLDGKAEAEVFIFGSDVEAQDLNHELNKYADDWEQAQDDHVLLGRSKDGKFYYQLMGYKKDQMMMLIFTLKWAKFSQSQEVVKVDYELP